VILAFFFVHDPRSYARAIHTVVPARYEAEVTEAVARVGTAIRHWIGGVFVAMLVMGTLAGVGLAIIGLPGWFPLALLTFAGTFVPYLGAILSAVPGLLLAFARSPLELLYATLVYGAVHVCEGYIVQPIIMKRAVRLRPAFLLLWQMLMAALFGIEGIVVATPLLVCVKALVEYLYIERFLGKSPHVHHV
jgi:predicted PurR-regulated permease PerM